MHMFGICDGHGPFGREASNFVKYAMNLLVEQKLPPEGKETGEAIDKALADSFNGVQQQFVQILKDEYESDPQIGFDQSGSTACILLMHGHKVITANAGNSRAIVVDKFRRAKQLTTDHVPTE